MASTPFRVTDMRVLGALAPQTGDIAPPTIPQNVVATAINAGRIDVTWTASTDEFGVAGYQIFRNGLPLNTTALTSYTDATCQPSTAYSYVIVAFDAAGNNSTASSAGNATTPANAAPVWQSIPAQTLIVGNAYLLTLTSFCTDADLDTLTFSVIAGTLPSGITLSGTRLQGTPTTAGQTPTITVRAADAFHQIDTTIVFSVKTADVTAPPTPTGLAATAVSSSQINISWNASTDVAGSGDEVVSGTKDYRLYRDGSLRTTVTAPTVSYSDTGLAASTQYAYRVSVRDNSLNESAQATQVTATTQSSSTGFTPQSGFSVLAATSFAHTLQMTVSRSAGSWGTHADFNPANYMWMGNRYVCFLMKSFEDGLYQTNGLNYQSGGAQWDVVTSSVTAPLANLTRSARQRGVSSRQGELVISPNINPTNLVASFWMKLGSGYDGKFFRIWGGSDSLYVSSGGTSGTTFRGGNNAADDVFSSPDNFSTTVWKHAEIYHKMGSGSTFKTYLNGALQWTKPWNAGNLNGHTTDLGNLLEVGNSVYFADYFIDFNPIVFYVTDSATFASSTVREPQIPITWSTTSVVMAINRGTHASLSGKHLHSYDYSTNTATYIGSFS